MKNQRKIIHSKWMFGGWISYLSLRRWSSLFAPQAVLFCETELMRRLFTQPDCEWFDMMCWADLIRSDTIRFETLMVGFGRVFVVVQFSCLNFYYKLMRWYEFNESPSHKPECASACLCPYVYSIKKIVVSKIASMSVSASTPLHLRFKKKYYTLKRINTFMNNVFVCILSIWT